MVGRHAAIGGLLVVALVYGAYPYFTLYRLGQALRRGDASILQSIVDWPAVREGIKEDICDLVIDVPQEAKHDDRLPPFGAGFVRGIAANVVDTNVTPEALAAVARRPATRQAKKDTALQLRWAFFNGPSAFSVDLTTPGEAAPIRLQMDLRDGAWRVTRVWLPANLLGGGQGADVSSASQ